MLLPVVLVGRRDVADQTNGVVHNVIKAARTVFKLVNGDFINIVLYVAHVVFVFIALHLGRRFFARRCSFMAALNPN